MTDQLKIMNKLDQINDNSKILVALSTHTLQNNFSSNNNNDDNNNIPIYLRKSLEE